MLCALCSALYAGQDPSQGARYAEGEVLVRYRSESSRQALSLPRLAAPAQRRRLRVLERIDARPVERIRVPGYSTEALIEAYRRHPSVEAVIPNYIRRVQRQILPDDSRFPQQWGLLNTGQVVNGTAGANGADIGATWAWPMARPATQTVVIAVIDTGVDYRHPDLTGAMWQNPGEDPASGLDDDGNGYVDDWFGYDFSGTVIDIGSGPTVFAAPNGDPLDNDGHGTHVAGIAAALANNAGGGIAGLADARIMALKASPDGTDMPLDDTLEAIAYAVMMKSQYNVPVVVINASYGSYGGSNVVERDLIINAGDAGIVFCAAAGNNGSNNDIHHFYPAGYRLPNVIAVGASDQQDGLASFSNYSSNAVHLAAPGVNIISTSPLWTVDTDTFLQQHPGGAAIDSAMLEFSGYTTESLTAPAYDCGLGYAHEFPPQVAGNIAMIERGVLNFSDKVKNAMDAGAIGAVIYNNSNSDYNNWTLSAPIHWIPAIAISQANGLALLAQSQPVTLTLSHPVDGTDAYKLKNGTSMAAPFVSGAVAFMARQYPDDNPAQRIARLLNTVDQLPAFAIRVSSGGRLNLRRAIDTDADGLPDWWEKDWAGDLISMDATSDYSANGFSDLHAYLAGTDPTDPNAMLRIAGIQSITGQGIEVAWESVDGRAYHLARGSQLDQVFSVIATNLPATPPLNLWTDPDPYSASNSLFYRVYLAE